ncbi:hypothetical protein OCF11_17800 [Bacillus cereus]|nr:hypothetical protein [Bacillus cereus]MCU5556579.1 hypothetical protein [Bacillus cereus]
MKQQKKEEPEICGSPEVGITCEHVQKEWENEQKLPKPKYTINGTTGQIFDEDGNEIIDGTKLPKNKCSSSFQLFPKFNQVLFI